ncbi:MAG: hypothetical protein HRT71_01680 [Flavobacteriales bacterium]|nr:hypothetical protein [Flavobacteriales bacterium]
MSRIIICLIFISTIFVSGCSIRNKIKGRLYVSETGPVFFYFLSKDSALYVASNNIGKPVPIELQAMYKIENDTVYVSVVFEDSIEEFILTYDSDLDALKDVDMLSYFRRIKKVKIGEKLYEGTR